MKKSFDKGIVAPHPVLIIGTYDEDGTPNAMNAAWGGQAGSNEISICLSMHNTTKNIQRLKEFTIAFATKETIAACDYVGIVSKNKVPNKLEKCNLTVTKSEKINAPIINERPLTIECKVVKIEEEFGDYRIVGEIVGMVADESILTNDKVDYDKLHLVTFDTVSLCYREVGGSVGKAWGVGKIFK